MNLLKGGLALMAAAVLVGCSAHGIPASTAAEAAGFWQGLWHGIIFPVTFFISLFNQEVGVYETVNSGGWYNFGFFLGVAMSMGGSGAGSRGRRKNQD